MVLLATCSMSILLNDSYHLSISLKWKTCTTVFADSTWRTCCEIFPIIIFLCWKLCLAFIQSIQGLEIREKEGNYKITNTWKICTSLDFFMPHLENMRCTFLHFTAVLVPPTTITTETSENKCQVSSFNE